MGRCRTKMTVTPYILSRLNRLSRIDGGGAVTSQRYGGDSAWRNQAIGVGRGLRRRGDRDWKEGDLKQLFSPFFIILILWVLLLKLYITIISNIINLLIFFSNIKIQELTRIVEWFFIWWKRIRHKIIKHAAVLILVLVKSFFFFNFSLKRKRKYIFWKRIFKKNKGCRWLVLLIELCSCIRLFILFYSFNLLYLINKKK